MLHVNVFATFAVNYVVVVFINHYLFCFRSAAATIRDYVPWTVSVQKFASTLSQAEPNLNSIDVDEVPSTEARTAAPENACTRSGPERCLWKKVCHH